MVNKESQTVEYKKNWQSSCLKVVSAFANSDGGTLVIGIDDSGNSVGLQHYEKLLEDIPNTIRNKTGIIPAVELEKNQTIKISIKPSAVPISYNGKYYIRSGSTVQELQGSALADFLSRKTGSTWDEVLEERAGIDHIDANAIEEFKRMASDRIPSIGRETDPVTVLKKLNLIENGSLKRAAVLLFGKNTQQSYRQAVVRVGKFLTDTDIKTTDIVKGNLFEQLDRTLNILATKYLVSNIEYEGVHRRDVLEYPYDALREAIINALIHRDYSGTSQTQIRVYPDKMLIMNEGRLPPELPLEKLKTNHLSLPRNTLLAEIFYYAGFIESWGRGTIKIVEQCLDQGLPEPDYKAENGVMTVVLYKDKWNEESLKKMGLNERQIKAVMYVKENGRITNSDYQNFGLKKRQATDDLKELEEKGILEKIGQTGRGTHYILRGVKRAKGASNGR